MSPTLPRRRSASTRDSGLTRSTTWQRWIRAHRGSPGVYRPLLDSLLLADALSELELRPATRLLDVCSGSGVIAIRGALHGARTTAVDVSRRAVLSARLNARLNGVRVRALRGSLFGPVAGERFDCIVSNPPYVPSTTVTPPKRGRARAWEGGLGGRLLIDRICDQAPRHLRPGGVLLLVHTVHVDEHRTIELLTAAGLDVMAASRATEPLGPIMTQRARDGLLPGCAGVDELVVLRATAPVKPNLRSLAPIELPRPLETA